MDLAERRTARAALSRITLLLGGGGGGQRRLCSPAPAEVAEHRGHAPRHPERRVVAPAVDETLSENDSANAAVTKFRGRARVSDCAASRNIPAKAVQRKAT
eukprot:5351345-Pleurochrysis_carterae.AAC.1